MKPTTSKPSGTLQGQYAGFVSRSIAYTIDLLVIVVTIALVGATLNLFLQFFRLDELLDTMLASQTILGTSLRIITFLGSTAFISFSYFVLAWTLTAGQSVGKLLIGIRIVPLDGTNITFWRSTLRYFALLLSALILFIGLLWVLVSDRRQGWHDKIAKTCVIYDWPAHEDDGVIGQLRSRWTHVKHTRQRLYARRAEQKAAGSDSQTDVTAEEIEST